MPQQTRKQRLSGPNLYRAARAEVTNFDAAKRTFDLSFASEDVEVLRQSYFDGPWLEVLGLQPDECDLTRLNSGTAPLLWGHDDYSRDGNIGVIEKAWLKDGRGYATVRLSARADVEGIAQDVQDGVLQNVSCGYQVQERTLTKEVDVGPDEYRVTRWLPIEISLVSIAADDTVGVGRSNANDANTRFTITDLDEETMEKKPGQSADETTTRAAGTPAAGDDPSQTIPRPTTAAAAEGGERQVPASAPADQERQERAGTPPDVQRIAADAIRAERERVTSIRALATEHELGDTFAAEHIASGVDLNAVRSAALKKLNERTVGGQGPGLIQIGTEQREKRAAQITDWLLHRSGVRKDGERLIDLNGNQYRGASMYDIAVDSLNAAGISVRGFDKMEIVKRAITHSTSDFATLFGNVFNKVLLAAYGITPDTWTQFSRIGSLSDFRQGQRYRAGAFGDLDKIPEGAEYKYGTIADAEKNPVQLYTYGKMFSLTRQAIINDDLGALTDILSLMGRGSKRTIEKAVYALLALNSGAGPTMGDGFALFSSQHGNLTSPGTAPSVASIALESQSMQTQTFNGDYIDVNPTTFLGPVALAEAVKVLNASQFDPTANVFQKPNQVRGMFSNIVGTPRLTSTPWYVFADPNIEPVIEVDFLNGNQTPYTEQRDGWNVDGVEYKVRHDFGVSAVGYRGARKNPGA